ncbi:hypothetical protein AGOR_G00210000 [Albula goreensis]|uniref:G patch domain-containing protein 4 n=1 Tax=Albula goreensis TaxID=1534307 RepID=A0A8T3CNQ9_9TELE|nr:hypothetical protein AGOR_G00210000 [Albula goreensis]
MCHLHLKMAEVEEKSRGLKFAEQQLLRHGWEQGKGLGRDENGISEAIKVKVKCDKGGVGHRQGEQFTFHWWDHVFNKASSSLVVESGQDGVKVKKTAGEGEEGMISNKKPRKAELAKAKLYGRFVKSGTLWSGKEQAEEKSSSSEDSSESEDEDQRLDLSSTTKLSDEDLMKACGGRTAHKGARHGLTMSAKLARLEQQEHEFLAKYGKKSKSVGSSGSEPVSSSNTLSLKEEETEKGGGKDKKSKKKKKKKIRQTEDKAEKTVEEDQESTILPDTGELSAVPKKKKKSSKEKHAVAEEHSTILSSTEKGRKKKKPSNEEAVDVEGEKCDFDCEVKEADRKQSSVSGESALIEVRREGSISPEVNGAIRIPKKKKRKKNKEAVSVVEEEECSNAAELYTAETVPKKKRKTNSDTNIPELEQAEQGMPLEQKKKNRTCTGEGEKEEDGGKDDTRTVKKKKKKRSQENGYD